MNTKTAPSAEALELEQNILSYSGYDPKEYERIDVQAFIDTALQAAMIRGAQMGIEAAASKAPVENYPTVNFSIRQLSAEQIVKG